MVNDIINIGLVSDDRYVPKLGACMRSIMENCNTSEKITFYIINDNISLKNIKKIQEMCYKFNSKIFFKTLSEKDKKPFKNIPLKNWNITIWYRLTFPSILKKINKIIYLDCDIVVEKDVADLMRIDISKYYAGCVVDTPPHSMKEHKKKIKIPSKDDYFNSGVLLINLKKWREEKVSQKAITFARKNSNKIVYPDQDALNFVLKGKWLHLSVNWNWFPLNGYANTIFRRKNKKQVKNFILKNKKLTHFHGWEFELFGYGGEKYYEYLKKTPWAESIPKPTLRKKIKKILIKFYVLFQIPIEYT